MIGLAAKNAILIVEFAVELRNKGLDLLTAAIDAGEIRFRPIIMTLSSFYRRCTLPLAFSYAVPALLQDILYRYGYCRRYDWRFLFGVALLSQFFYIWLQGY